VTSRREFLALASIGSLFDWVPFLRPKHISLAGARFRIRYNGRSNRRYLLIHGDEETARRVLERHIETHEGIAYIIESRTRTVRIGSGEVDPNRIFSRAGAEANLKTLNPEWKPEEIRDALATLDRGREKLAHAFFPPHGGLLIALHNNSVGYSVFNEEPISNRASIREPARPHAFFVATDPADYQILAGSPYNVVLQDHAKGDNDGSLSRLAAERRVRYVNLEVGMGHEARQQEMLAWLEWYLP
jgi:hypothetical protein